MAEYTEFPKENIEKALTLARRSAEDVNLEAQRTLAPEFDAQLALRAGPANFSAGCVGLVSEGNRVCLRLPFVGDICVPVDLPDGTAAEACVDVCTRWGIPTGVCLKVKILNDIIFRQCFGWC